MNIEVNLGKGSELMQGKGKIWGCIRSEHMIHLSESVYKTHQYVQ